ncbi:MAG: hypothetical protein AAF704_01665, partial [Cyanobacteria bacterium P01_D01_bin.123]
MVRLRAAGTFSLGCDRLSQNRRRGVLVEPVVALDVDFEPQTQIIGRRLIAATQARSSILAQMREQLRWDDRLLAWAMEN